LELVAFQSSSPLQSEGLPYWIFWFLLCVILLLLFFIFLRDKQLRMRLSSFLAGAKRRSLLIQLRIRLKKERQKRGEILRKLGEKAWDEDIPIQGSEHIRAELEALLDKKGGQQAEWNKALAELESLHQKLDDSARAHEEKLAGVRAEKLPFDELLKRKQEEEKELRKKHHDRDVVRQITEARRERETIQDRVDEFEDNLKDIEAEARSERRELEKELRHWTRRKDKAQERIKEIEAEEAEFHASLGRLTELRRVENQDLAALYLQIDDVNRRIVTLQHRIESLSGA
jgi:chromosome segregation ATPase